MGPLAIEMVKGYQADRLQQIERERVASRARRARRARREQAAQEPRRAPATLPRLRELAGATGAVRVGSTIEVGATGALGPDGRVRYLGDPYRQTQQALDQVAETLQRFGAGLADVVRTRVYLKKSWQWEEVGRAHGEIFGDTQPVTTFVGAGGFPDSDMLVAVEATAVIR